MWEQRVWILCCKQYDGHNQILKQHEKGSCKYILLSLAGANILPLFRLLLYLYSHNNCIMQDFKPAETIDIAALKEVQETFSDYILKEIINPEGKFYDAI